MIYRTLKAIEEGYKVLNWQRTYVLEKTGAKRYKEFEVTAYDNRGDIVGPFFADPRTPVLDKPKLVAKFMREYERRHAKNPRYVSTPENSEPIKVKLGKSKKTLKIKLGR